VCFRAFCRKAYSHGITEFAQFIIKVDFLLFNLSLLLLGGLTAIV
jgi:hypothetical protein